MRSSNPDVATEKERVPYARKRNHPQFEGIRRSNSTRNSQKPVEDKPNLSRSLSDIWKLESKQNAPNIANKDMKLGDSKPIDEEEAEIFTTSKKNEDVHKGYLPQCAASYYKGKLMRDDESVLCKSIDKLNKYLKACKDEIRAGVPGRYLYAVIGQDATDVACFVCAITYAFFLSMTRNNSQSYVVPIISMKRAELANRSELKWLVKSSGMDEASFIFVDEVELPYYDQFGNLKIVLVNGNKLPAKQEGLKDAVTEIFHCKEVDLQYPMVEEITMARVQFFGRSTH